MFIISFGILLSTSGGLCANGSQSPGEGLLYLCYHSVRISDSLLSLLDKDGDIRLGSGSRQSINLPVDGKKLVIR